MKINTKEYQHYVESIACLYTIDQGCIKVIDIRIERILIKVIGFYQVLMFLFMKLVKKHSIKN